MKEALSFRSILVGIYLFSVPVFSYSLDLHLNDVPQFIGIILIVYAIYDSLKPHEKNRTKFILFYSLFVIWSVFSYLFVGNYSQPDGIFTLIKVALIIGSTAYLIKTEDDFTYSLSIFFISIFLTVWLNLNDILNLRNINNFGEEERFAGTFSNANTAALFCIAIIWAGITLLFIKKHNFIVRLAIIMGLILACFVIVYSGSRKGLIGLGFFSITIAWFSIKKFGYTFFRKLIVVSIALGTLFVILYMIYTSPFFNRVSGTLQGDASSAARLYLFKEAISLWHSSVKNLLIGIGINNFQFYNNLNTYSHSTISETLVCTGIVGFALFYLSFFSVFSAYFKVPKNENLDLKINMNLLLIFIIVVLFFSSTAVMYDDKFFLPLLAMISSYVNLIKKNILNNEESLDIQSFTG
jgi:O-antigen ligase